MLVFTRVYDMISQKTVIFTKCCSKIHKFSATSDKISRYIPNITHILCNRHINLHFIPTSCILIALYKFNSTIQVSSFYSVPSCMFWLSLGIFMKMINIKKFSLWCSNIVSSTAHSWLMTAKSCRRMYYRIIKTVHSYWCGISWKKI